jgi:hypothetical protein
MSWFLVLVVWGVLVVSVILGVAGDLHDSRFGRCSFTSTGGGKIMHFCMYFVLLVVPSLLTLFFYGQIVNALLGYKKSLKSRRPFARKNSRIFIQHELRYVGSTIKTKSFLTISIILIFYYLTLIPSFILRDLPMILSLILGRNFLQLPSSVTVLSSVAFYFSTLIDPIVYGLRSPHIFKTIKQIMWYINEDDVAVFENRISSTASCSLSRFRISSDVCSNSKNSIWKPEIPMDCQEATSRKRIHSNEKYKLARPKSFHHQLQQRNDLAHVGLVFQTLLPVLARVRTTRMRVARRITF